MNKEKCERLDADKNTGTARKIVNMEEQNEKEEYWLPPSQARGCFYC